MTDGKTPEEKHELLRDWCGSCGEDAEDHATATVDGEETLICPVEERSEVEENPQEQLGAFAPDSTNPKDGETA